MVFESRSQVSTRDKSIHYHLVALLYLLLVSTIFAETTISGDITNVIFTDSANPFIVATDISVPEGAKVTIGPGCILLFEAQTGLKINGTFEVLGDSALPVVFTSKKDQAYDTTNKEIANPFDWNGITIEKSAGKTILNNFKLMFSVYGIKCFNENIQIENGYFRQNGSGNLLVNGKKQLIEENKPVALVITPPEAQTTAVTSSFIGSGDATLYIKTEPAGAKITLENIPLDKVTPLRIDSILPGQYTIKAVINNLVASKNITIESGAVKTVELTLERVKTSLRVISEPLEAEVFIDKPLTIRSKPDLMTPWLIKEVPEKKAMTFHFFKPGYRDTAVTLQITSSQLNNIYVELSQADEKVQLMQKRFLRERKQATFAKFYFIGAGAFFAGTAYSSYRAWKDYSIAADAKTFLEHTVDHQSSIYKQKVRENSEHVDIGNRWRSIAAGLGVLGSGVLGTGLVFYF